MEVYVYDMLMKSKYEDQHIAHLDKFFNTLNAYGMKLNLSKCTFRVKVDKFIGYKVTERGLQYNQELDLPHPKIINEVQQLVDKVIALSRFISRSAEKNLPFFKVLSLSDKFEWNDECTEASESLKAYLVAPSLLAKSITGEPVSTKVINSVLVQIKMPMSTLLFTTRAKH